MTVDSFAFTGAAQTFVVPDGVTSIDVLCRGGKGGTAFSGGIPAEGGLGATMQCTLAVTPGETLQVNVGGGGSWIAYPAPGALGGWNGGGDANVYGGGGASGGGASDVRQGGTTLAERVVVAAGGGGGGSNNGVPPGVWGDGGDGGYPDGQNGEDGYIGVPPGGGATQVVFGGAGGSGFFEGHNGFLGIGGPGGNNGGGRGGGAGGGGLYGGGGGAAGGPGSGGAGGGGGSSLSTGVDTVASTHAGVDGSIVLTYVGIPGPPVVIPPSDDDLLDLELGTRVSGFRYDLLDAANQPVGSIEVDETDGPPRVTNNINRTIKRTMDGLVLPPAVQADINPLVHRVKPWMVLSNGSEFPLGVFLFADDTAEPYSFGDFGHGQMVDQGLILDQPASTGSGYSPGTLLVDAIGAEFTKAGLTSWLIDPTITGVVGAAIAWPAGTSRAVICAELCNLAGAYSPFFDNDGLITVRRVDDLATATPELRYFTDLRSRILFATTTRSNDALDAPNQYIVIDGSAADSPVVGVYDIPRTAPHSFAQRGFHVATVITEDGLANEAAAVARAQAAYNAGGGAALEHIMFATPPDPRHDTFQVVAYDGVNFREQEWSMALRDGTDMTHHLRRSYQPTTPGTSA